MVCPQRPPAGTAGDQADGAPADGEQADGVAGELGRYLQATGQTAAGLATSLLGRPARVREVDQRVIGGDAPDRARSARQLVIEDFRPPHRALVLVWEQARLDRLPSELADRWSAGQPLLAVIPAAGATWTVTAREVEAGRAATAGAPFDWLPGAALASIVWQVTTPTADSPVAVVLEELPVAADDGGQLLLPAQDSAVPPLSPAQATSRRPRR